VHSQNSSVGWLAIALAQLGTWFEGSDRSKCQRRYHPSTLTRLVGPKLRLQFQWGGSFQQEIYITYIILPCRSPRSICQNSKSLLLVAHKGLFGTPRSRRMGIVRTTSCRTRDYWDQEPQSGAKCGADLRECGSRWTGGTQEERWRCVAFGS
jgi:hypothetical protein